MLTTEPGVPAARWRRPISRVQLNVPLRVMSTTVRQALGDMSSAGTPKLAAALFTSTSGSPKAASALSNAVATDSGSRMSQTAVATAAPSSSIAARPASRCSSERLAITIAAPSRANSAAMALPSPVPPPVTSTVRPSKVPGRSAVSPAGGGGGRPGGSAVISAGTGIEAVEPAAERGAGRTSRSHPQHMWQNRGNFAERGGPSQLPV